MKNELGCFKDMFSKARLIVTTNYDEFIEKQLNYSIKIRVGNKGLFEPAGELNELYKIHGSIKEVNSIMITSKDYKSMERTSAIVNAKILSVLTESPILFIGYSLTDKNIQSLLIDLANNMPFEIEIAAKRIGVVQYEQGRKNVLESLRGTNYGVHYTQLTTDNFCEIYNAITGIDQGISPLEISKYQNAFKKIIEMKGEKGELNQVLTTFVDLERLPQELKKKRLVVAFGDNKYLFRFPDYVDYIKSYFLPMTNPMPLEIAIKFILTVSPQSTLPVSKYISQKMQLEEETKHKINLRLERFKSLESLQKTVSLPKMTEEVLKTYELNDVIDFFRKDDDIKVRLKLAYLIKNIKIIDASYLIEYILINESDSLIKDTNTRKLFMAYSLATEKIIKKIE